jgi:ribose/xylose/arabinose/galactoside ABC-type transport system permease subunit
VIIFAFLCVVLAIISPDFRKVENLTSVATALRKLVFCALRLCNLTAGIDLSVGSIAAFASMTACRA